MHPKTNPAAGSPANPYEMLARPAPAPEGATLAERLKAWRMGNGLTQAQAAHLIDVPLSSYVQTEHGAHEPGAFGRRFLEILLGEWEKSQPVPVKKRGKR